MTDLYTYLVEQLNRFCDNSNLSTADKFKYVLENLPEDDETVSKWGDDFLQVQINKEWSKDNHNKAVDTFYNEGITMGGFTMTCGKPGVLDVKMILLSQEN